MNLPVWLLPDRIWTQKSFKKRKEVLIQGLVSKQDFLNQYF